MKTFEDYIVQHENVIDLDLCNQIIEKFDTDDRTYDGISGAGEDPSIKISKDLGISGLEDWKSIDDQLFENTTSYFSDYLNNYLEYTNNNSPNMFHDLGYQVQKTTPGGHYAWHHDYMSNPLMNTIYRDSSGFVNQWVQSRIYTFILYLNDRTDEADNGRTQFYNCGVSKSIVPKAGKLLLFPANPFWVHRGEPLTTGVKYLITGWCCGYSPYRLGRADRAHMDTLQSYIREESTL